jgi:hypothetical protein
VPAAQADQYQQAIEQGKLEAVLDKMNTPGDENYEPFAQYYPTDRGQQRDPVSGESQRTFNRWQDPPDHQNIWQFGQSTWLYQDPNGGDAPPAGLPISYTNGTLSYYFHYQCEQTPTADPLKDCLNWQIYIELLARDNNDTYLGNWARGGWKRVIPHDIEWEIYYKPDAFDGQCDKDYIQTNFSDAYLADPANKAPLLFRIPNRPGIYSATPKICVVIFNGYYQQAQAITQAYYWRVTGSIYSKELVGDRYLINADNTYYAYQATI